MGSLVGFLVKPKPRSCKGNRSARDANPEGRPRNGCWGTLPAFRGTFEHSLDQRGRIAIPARYRSAFAEGGVLTPSADGCLELYPAATFDEIAEALTAEGANLQRGRRLRRALYARSWDVELDKQGRILIPPTMRELVQVEDGLVLAGRGECLELWSQERWNDEAIAVERDYASNLEAQERATS